MSSFDFDHPTVVQLTDRYTQLNRKATPQDAEQSRVVREVAEYYAANYTGTFEFMIKMHDAMKLFNKLSIGQASGVINCLMNEYRQRAKAFTVETLPNLPAEAAHNATTAPTSTPVVSIRQLPIQAVCGLCGVLDDVSYDTSLTPTCVDTAACAERRSSPVAVACKNGTYTIILDETGNYRTLKLSEVPVEKCVNGIPQGAQYVGYLRGPNNDSDYQPMGYVCGTQLRIKSQYRSDTPLTKALTILLGADREMQIDYGHAYAVESGSCWRCNRKLTVPASLNRGVGPECAKKLGL